MTDYNETSENGGAIATAAPEPAKPAKPQFFKVVLTHPIHHSRVVFRSISEKRAVTWLENHFPRGSEAHLVAPDGTIRSYEAERRGENGADAPQWAGFDPSEWLPVDQAPPPGDSEWADKEG